MALHITFMLLLALAVSLHVPLTDLATDSFHEGEYVMFAQPGMAPGGGPLPVFIHGGINHIPARIAGALCADDALIVCTRIVNGGFISLASLLFVATCLLLTGAGTLSAAIAGLPAILVLLAYNGGAPDVVALHHGAPAIRDLVPLLALVATLLCARLLDHPSGSMALRSAVVALGFVAGFGLFWAYNRGLAVLALSGTVTLAIAWATRRLVILLAGLLGLLVGLAAAAGSGLFGDWTENLANVRYWVANPGLFSHGSVWTTLQPGLPALFILRGAALLLMMGATMMALRLAWRYARSGAAGAAIGLGALALLQAIYVVQSLPRPDEPHIGWALWPTSLLAVALFSRALAQAADLPRVAIVTAWSALAGLVLASYAPRHPFRTLAALPGELTANAAAMRAPLPRDETLLQPGPRAAAALLASQRGGCTLAATNEGLIQVVARVPACSRFFYAVYVAPAYQAEVLDALRRAAPPMLIADSPSWSNVIDGRGLAIRTPELARWIEETYPHRIPLPDGYVARARTAPP